MPVYVVEAVGLGLCKIGTSSNPVSRIGKIAADCPVPIVVIAVLDGGKEHEGSLHERFSGQHVRGEWFTINEEIRGLAIRSIKYRKRKALEPNGAFSSYLIANDYSALSFSRKAGVAHTTVTRLLDQGIIPQRATARKIVAATDGAVTEADLVAEAAAARTGRASEEAA